MAPPESLRAFPPRGTTAFAAGRRGQPEPLLAVPRFGKAGARQRRGRGFTLIELLVALAAMALVAIMSWRGLDGMMRTQESTRAQGEQQTVLQTVLAQWNADLNALMPLEGQQVLDWDGQVLRLTRQSSGPVDQGAWVVAWSRRNVEGRFQWVRWQSLPLRTISEWTEAWAQAAQWGRNPSSDQMRRETVLLPLDQWRVYYYRSNAWSNPLSSDASTNTGNPTTSQTRALPTVPDGIRIELTLPEGRAMNGVLILDWVNPLRSNSRS